MANDSVLLNSAQNSYDIVLSTHLSDAEQETITASLDLLPSNCIASTQLQDSDFKKLADDSTLFIKKIVDGRGLACPMPLLKTKVALRDVANGESLYVIATDPNSKADITAFCQNTKKVDNIATLFLVVNQTTGNLSDDAVSTTVSTTLFDTIFHFIITKTDSN